MTGRPARSDAGWTSTPATRRKMQAQGRANTEPELALRRELHRRGLRYRLHARVVPGTNRRTVDIVFPSARVAVFVDGCFWHGCPAHRQARPQTNTALWIDKITNNAARDRDTDARLTEAGWTIVRIWEHENPSEAADRIEQAVRRYTV